MAQTTAIDPAYLDSEIRKLGEQLWPRLQGERPGLFNRSALQGRLLDWVMKDPSFKVDLFRFVDVLPVLRSTEQVARHVREYLLRDGRELPGLVSAALKAASGGLAAGLAARTIKQHLTELATRFIAGRDVAAALPVLRQLHREGFACTVDLLGEATLSDAEAEAYAERYLALIDTLAAEAPSWPAHSLLDHTPLGPLPRANVSLKVSALAPQLDPVDAAGSVRRLRQRVLPLLLRARERNVFVNFDLEQWALHRITYDLFAEVALHPQLRDWPHLGIVVQVYLRRAPEDAERLLALARRRGTPLTVRLVKGAYWDYEVVHARQHGYPCPVLTDKAATDAQYEQLTAFLLAHHEELWPAFGSHNLRSLLHALVLARELGLPAGALEVQMLYGMAEPERKALRDLGYRVRVYTPVGELLPGMAYLVRRLLENTANQGFLRLSHYEQADLGTLLARPQPRPAAPASPDLRFGDLQAPFANCPLTDFTDAAQCEAFAKAVEACLATLPRRVPVVVDGRPRYEGAQLQRVCPSDTRLQVATVTLATRADADAAVAAATQAWPAWRDTPLEARALLLERLAERLYADRLALAALQTLEVAKPWREADADVAEAIDYCRYYARQALEELAPQRLGPVPGEDNVLWYEGRGPAVIIAPWNFPLAILCGMATAALVAGNPVILKPAEQASAVAYAFYEHLRAAGFPPQVVQFLPGLGEEVGSHLVAHPGVAQIAFTGSMAVGLALLEAAAKTHPGQRQVKRVVCEMGGKNAIIVDEDADLDEAVAGVVQSAFGYAGQKCSACSRVLVVGSAYEPFVQRLIAACRSLLIAPAHSPACRLGPVVDAEAYERLRRVIADPGPGAQPLYVGEAPAGGFYVAPAIFAVQDAQHRLMQEELFGPVLAVMHVATFAEALEVAVSTRYALTGGVYSRTPSHLAQARQRFRVGNLYLNRPCTGAMVQRQPFGGFGMSGLGSKAGGPGYLRQFADARCVTENTMRHGFTPDVAW
ncbi:MAG: L-glutamate gamma-semialdehyde dehydrogenase [Candidatus Tectimicrobiota bacterium]|nr:MAG: L-glutamate gamma-semialdehyde dehydrogenase [Candidatus Tectomicrobia bacterium]